MQGLAAIIDAVAASLDPLTTEVAGLQVTAGLNPNPTPPSLDVYPGGPSGTMASFNGWEENIIVRARVSAPDDMAAQDVLLGLMDADGPGSVITYLRIDPSFGGVVGGSAVDERSGFLPYPGDYLGCEWRVRTIQ